MKRLEKKENGCTYGKETRIMLQDFKEMFKEFVSNEIKHLKEDIDGLYKEVRSVKMWTRTALISLLLSLIAALIIALVSKL